MAFPLHGNVRCDVVRVARARRRIIVPCDTCPHDSRCGKNALESMIPDDALLLTLMVALPFLGSVVAAFLPTNARNAEAWLAGAVALIVLLIAAQFHSAVDYGEVVRAAVEWVPQLGLEFVLRLDGFAWMFALLISGIGLLVVVYARYYLSPADPVPRFFSFLLAFMGSMLGIVLSGNLIQLVFFWELTSLFSFLLIGYWHHNAAARNGARTALAVTAAGGLALLGGVLVLGHIVGSYDLDRVLASGDRILAHPLYLPALVLILLGAFTKSAQFPFHFWLPRAMAAPTPVSAYLHSATMVKAGVFLLARLWPVLAGSEYWFWIVSTVGLATFVFGAFFAIFQRDLKGLLAYSTISHLGIITLLLGLGSPLAAVAGIFHMMNHAAFKASLFMAAGIIDHEAGTRDMNRLSGLFRFLPITATLAMVAAAAMAGVPLLNGFLSKEMFFTETVAHHVESILDQALPYVATFASTFTVAYSVRFIHQVFFGPAPTDLPRTPREPPHWMRLPIELLVLACLLVGILPQRTIGPYLATAVRAVLGPDTPHYSLAVWHGITPAFVMSLFALGGGAALYALLLRYPPHPERVPLLGTLRERRPFTRALVAMSLFWGRQLERLSAPRGLQAQLRVLVLVAMSAAFWPLFRFGLGPDPGAASRGDVGFALVWLVGIGCAVGAAWMAKYQRLAALIMMGGAGLVTCITFVWFSAPDLALTQLLVEIVTVVLILLGLRWLPKRLTEIESGRAAVAARVRRLRDLAVAIVAGGGMAALAYAVMIRPVVPGMSHHFLERAKSEGGGANVVNVILVDFRGFDTFGEITVLGAVALTVFALLRRFRPPAESIAVPEQQRIQNTHDADDPERNSGDSLTDYLHIPSLLMRLLFPVVGVFGVYLFLRGHDLPGGGFVAGLTLAIAVILQYMAGGTRWVEARLRILPLRWMGSGLLLAAVGGGGAWWFGYPFLTSHTAHVRIPVIGDVALASAMLFDLGVMALVVGATVLILIALAHQSLRSERAPRATLDPVPTAPAPIDPVPDGASS